jgi:hypothetical protein
LCGQQFVAPALHRDDMPTWNPCLAVLSLLKQHTQAAMPIHYANAQRAKAPIEVAGNITFLSKCPTGPAKST